MATATQHIKHGWVWLLCLLIFFFNTVSFLPKGVTIVLLLTPLWLYFLHKQNKLKLSIALLLPLLLYIPIHLYNGVNLTYYLISTVVLCSLSFFVTSWYFLLKEQTINLDVIFKDIAILNFILVIGCIPLLFMPSLKELVWYMIPISDNIKPIPRLKLFTSEASHYSFILAPVAIYFYSRALFFKTSNPIPTLLIVTVPLLLSFSLGVLTGLIISGIFVSCIFITRIFTSWKHIVAFATIAILIIAGLLFINHHYPHNALTLRIHNIFSGRDTSARGRTYEAFILAHKIAGEKSYLWGIGPGQLKLLGRSIIVSFYSYAKIPGTIRIPNACAETIAYFGYVGFALRMLIEGSFFFKTKVYIHPFRLWLFTFVFIYQFTGSYITNAAEYIIWILAFSNIFPEFINNKNRQLKPFSEK